MFLTWALLSFILGAYLVGTVWGIVLGMVPVLLITMPLLTIAAWLYCTIVFYRKLEFTKKDASVPPTISTDT